MKRTAVTKEEKRAQEKRKSRRVSFASEDVLRTVQFFEKVRCRSALLKIICWSCLSWGSVGITMNLQLEPAMLASRYNMHLVLLIRYEQ